MDPATLIDHRRGEHLGTGHFGSEPADILLVVKAAEALIAPGIERPMGSAESTIGVDQERGSAITKPRVVDRVLVDGDIRSNSAAGLWAIADIGNQRDRFELGDRVGD